MSGPVVVIGYILLIPSFLSMLFCVIAIALAFGAGFAEKTDPISQRIMIGVSSIGLIFGVSCFVAGLLGWLLVMKKKILICSICGAVVNAS
jgi:hypothetical protein